MTISVYSVVLFIHVASAVALIGSSLFAPLARRQILEAGSAAELKTAIVLAGRGARFNPAISLALLASGLYMGSLGWWRQPWFLVALGAWVLNATLALSVIKRIAGALAQAVIQNNEGLNERVDRMRRSMAWTLAARVMLGTDFSLLFIMLNKPGLAASLAVLGGTITLLVAPCLLRPGWVQDSGSGATTLGFRVN